MRSDDGSAVHRYTSFEHALEILETRRIRLRSPSGWRDMNDTRYLDAFCEYYNFPSLRVLCLTSASETSHHWGDYASGPEGVRLVFHRGKFFNDARRARVQIRNVIYVKLDEIRQYAHRPADWPYLKRYPYRGEAELRLLSAGEGMVEEVPLAEGTLTDFVLSPSLPTAEKAERAAVVKKIRDRLGVKVRVFRSTLYQNDDWIRPIQQALETRTFERQSTADDGIGDGIPSGRIHKTAK